MSPAVPENGTAYGYDGPTRSPSGYAPQAIDQQQFTSGGIPPIPESPPPQEAVLAGRHQSLAAPSTVSPIDSYRGSYLSQPDSGLTQAKYAGSEASYGNNANPPAAPHYNAPVTGYYAPGVQYNPNQSYGVGSAPYPQAQSPPPVKSEHSYYVGAPPPPVPPVGPPAGAVAVAADGGKKKKQVPVWRVAHPFAPQCIFLLLTRDECG